MKRKRANPEAENPECAVDIELHLDTPLPLEWQRCLDIQSGQIHFYNTKTHTRTSRDPRRSPVPASSPSDGDAPLSLDLELNLKCQSIKEDDVEIGRQVQKRRVDNLVKLGKDEQEMVARVCVRCHLLVMVLKRSPACPNCKFMHPPELHSPPAWFMKDQRQSFANPIQSKV